MKFRTKPNVEVDVGFVDLGGQIGRGCCGVQVAVIDDRGRAHSLDFEHLEAFFEPGDETARVWLDGMRQRRGEQSAMLRRPYGMPPPYDLPPDFTPPGYKIETDDDGVTRMTPITPKKKSDK